MPNKRRPLIPARRSPRAAYNAGLRWIAFRDTQGAGTSLRPPYVDGPAISRSETVQLLADMFDVSPLVVARHVVNLRLGRRPGLRGYYLPRPLPVPSEEANDA